VRLLRSWEGLRRRVASLDSSGVGLTDLYDSVLPVLVAGHDQSDQARLSVGGIEVLAFGLNFAWAGIACDTDVWVEEVRAENTNTALPHLVLAPVSGLDFAPYSVFGEAWLQTPSQVRLVYSAVSALPPGPGFFVSPNWKWERPGFLVQAGQVLLARASSTGGMGNTLTFQVALRET